MGPHILMDYFSKANSPILTPVISVTLLVTLYIIIMIRATFLILTLSNFNCQVSEDLVGHAPARCTWYDTRHNPGFTGAPRHRPGTTLPVTERNQSTPGTTSYNAQGER